MMSLIETIKMIDTDDLRAITLSNKDIKEKELELKGRLSQEDWQAFKLYKKSMMTINGLFERGEYKPEIETPAWVAIHSLLNSSNIKSLVYDKKREKST